MSGPIATAAWIALLVSVMLSLSNPLGFGGAPFLITFALVFAVVSTLAVLLSALNRR